MAILTNESDQFAILFDVAGRNDHDPDWITARVAMQYHGEELNALRTFLQATIDIYESDLIYFTEQLRAFGTVTDESKNFEFEPEVEPSFHFSFQRVPHNKSYCRVVSFAIDLKRVIKMLIPCAYRENRITLKVHTTEERIKTFSTEFLEETRKIFLNRGLPTRRG